ncbi:MAG: S41 family peptidase [Cyclobacteriaceae bacterium]
MKTLTSYNLFPLTAMHRFLPILFLTMVPFAMVMSQKIDPVLCQQAAQMHATISEFHVIKDNNSLEYNKRVVEKLISKLDYYGILFTQADVEAIKAEQNNISLDLILGGCSFANAAFNIYRKKIMAFDSVMKLDATWQTDFTTPDSITLFGRLNKLIYEKSEDELKQKIIKRIKYLTLIDYQTSLDSVQGSLADFRAKQDSLISGIRQMEACRMAHFMSSEESLVQSFMDEYMSAIADSFDPHTNYMTIKEMEDFEFSLSEQIYSTGLVVDEVRNGVYVVVGKIPGSAADDMDQIKEGDEILKVKYHNKDIHPACLEAAELMNLLNNPEPEEVSLSLKKQSGKIENVTIRKSLIENLSNEIGTLVLEDSIRVGYISLPSFYRNMDNPNSNSSQDIATQVLKLRTKNTDGLIIDLRYNGGGSVQEAVDLASLFLAGGPLIQEVSREENMTLRDKNKGAIYTGKLIVLVNTLSASASEMFVSMMKAHSRALIVGNQTFGKASGQLMGPLTNPDTDQEFGALKLTVMRYYGLDGTTFQRTGITPDIVIPDGFPHALFSEENQDYALEPNEYDKNIRLKKSLFKIPKNELKFISDQRQNSNAIYQSLKTFSDSITQEMKSIKSVPLTVDEFIKATYYEPYDSTKYDYPVDEQFKLEVISGLTQFGHETDEQLRYGIASDATLREAIHILRDWKRLDDER